nr:hypothetical protein [Eubacterium sp.]
KTRKEDDEYLDDVDDFSLSVFQNPAEYSGDLKAEIISGNSVVLLKDRDSDDYNGEYDAKEVKSNEYKIKADNVSYGDKDYKTYNARGLRNTVWIRIKKTGKGVLRLTCGNVVKEITINATKKK